MSRHGSIPVSGNAVFYGGCYVIAGSIFHNQIQQVMVWFDRVSHGVIGFGLVLMVGYLAYKYTLRHRSNASKRRANGVSETKRIVSDDGVGAKRVPHALGELCDGLD